MFLLIILKPVFLDECFCCVLNGRATEQSFFFNIKSRIADRRKIVILIHGKRSFQRLKGSLNIILKFFFG